MYLKQLNKKNKDKDNWETPNLIIDIVKKIYDNQIILDPASSEQANKRIKSKCIYTIENDGLKNVWFGKVFLNPPYSSKILDFIKKFVKEKNNIEEIIILVNATFSTKWSRLLLDNCYSLCLLSERVKFINPNTQQISKSPSFIGQCIYYYGFQKDKFKEKFSPLGKVLFL